jgi:hypothetical protein
LERVGKVVESAYRTQIDHIARQFIGNDSLDVGTDFVGLATAYLAQRELPSYLLIESHASGAMNASSHASFNERTNILVLYCALILHVPAFSVAVNQ